MPSGENTLSQVCQIPKCLCILKLIDLSPTFPPSNVLYIQTQIKDQGTFGLYFKVLFTCFLIILSTYPRLLENYTLLRCFMFLD